MKSSSSQPEQSVKSRNTLASSMLNPASTAVPIMERPEIAFVLAIIAGLMNGYTYHVSKIFSTVQSGNIILLGETIATKNWPHFYAIMFTVLAFGVGSMLTAIVERIYRNKNSHSWTFVIIAIEALVLIILASGYFNNILSISTICIIISFVAGLQGNAFHKVKGMLYGNVAVTLVVQLAFSNLMQAIQGDKGTWRKAVIFFSVLLGFGLGGYAGTLATIRFGEVALLLPAILLILLLIYLLLAKEKGDDSIDPAS